VTAVAKLGRAALAAVTFLTVLPVGRRVALDGADVARGSVLFPVVGAAAGGLARVGGPVLAAALPYAQVRPGAGEALSAHPSTARTVLVGAIGVAVAIGLVGPDVWAPLLVLAVVVLVVARSSYRRLGGVTGDVMGATSELVEIGSLALLVALR
jgi:adenosylcobinamide-GDP ribazoletransferase